MYTSTTNKAWAALEIRCAASTRVNTLLGDVAEMATAVKSITQVDLKNCIAA